MQIIKLDINPKGEIPVLYVSQYDNGREFGIELVDGEEAYNVPSGYSVQLNVRKTDSKLVTKTPETVSGNMLTFGTTEQMTACPGNNIASLTLKDTNDIVITTLYFIIEVQRDVLAGGLDSVSEIDNLTQQIEDIATEVIGEDYYNKAETDALLDDKANSADLATVATSGDYDDLINKPTIPAAQVQSDYAQADNTQVDYIKNKPDISGMIAAALLAVMPVETATGNPCSFDTDIVAELQGLTADIVASGGGGTPATPNPIVGHSEINLDVNGDTFTVQFGQTVYGGVYDANRGKLKLTWGYKDLGTCTWYLRNATSSRQAWNTTAFIGVIKSPANLSTPYNALCDSFIGVDYNGVWLPGTYANSSMTDDTIAFCSQPNEFADADAFKASVNGVIFAFELATPIEIDVSELSVDTIVGTNNITSDCGGDVTASYKVSIQKYIDDHV